MGNILHIITGLEVGGAERMLFTLLTNGLEGPFRNRVISLMGLGHYGSLLESAGIPVICLNMRPARPGLSAVRRLLAATYQKQTDILQGWMTHGNLAATLARRLSQPEAALAWNVRRTLEARAEAKAMTRSLNRIAAMLSRQPQAIIYNAQRARAQHEAMGYCGAAGRCLPNGFDTAQWAPSPKIRCRVRAELGLLDTDRVIGFVGRGHPDKGPSNLFAAFDLISRAHPNARLVAVGRDLEQFATSSNRVMLLGQRSDVNDLMKGFDLLCLSSLVEGFPNVLGEAMASGVPCVSTDVGDAREIVGDTGWIAPPRDPSALANCLDQALIYPPDALRKRGHAARARIVRHYSIGSIVSRYVALYHELEKESS